MQGINLVTESPLLVPLVALFLMLLLLAVVALLLTRNKRSSPQRTFLTTVDEAFLSPTANEFSNEGVREHTYVMSRNWKPSNNGVYSALSIPLTPQQSPKTLVGRMGSMIHVLPPKSTQAFV